MEEIKKQQNNNEKINETFSIAEKEINQNRDLSVLMEQICIDSNKKLFDQIKENMLKHLKHYGSSPINWNDESFYYGHVGILLNDQIKTLESKVFTIPSLKIEIHVGKIRELPYGMGMRLIWQMIKDPHASE